MSLPLPLPSSSPQPAAAKIANARIAVAHRVAFIISADSPSTIELCMRNQKRYADLQ
jgi:hypothetical protein